EHGAEPRPIDRHLLHHLQFAQVRLEAEEAIAARLERGPERRERWRGAPELESRRAEARVRRDLQPEVADRFGWKNERRQLAERVSLGRERKIERLGCAAGNPLEAGNVLAREVEVPAPLAMLLRDVARRASRGGQIRAESLEERVAPHRTLGLQ